MSGGGQSGAMSFAGEIVSLFVRPGVIGRSDTYFPIHSLRRELPLISRLRDILDGFAARKAKNTILGMHS
jgi:hypothetical protein